MAGRKIEVIEGSGNVFADLGLEDASELKAKSGLIFEIGRVIEERGLTQAQTVELIGLDQPKVSNLLRGKLTGFSTDRLLKILNALGQDVEIMVRIKPASERRDATVIVGHIASA